jgi:hypothetical protein
MLGFYAPDAHPGRRWPIKSTLLAGNRSSVGMAMFWNGHNSSASRDPAPPLYAFHRPPLVGYAIYILLFTLHLRRFHPTFHVTHEAPCFYLDSDWAPTGAAAGTLRLTLTNLSGRPLSNFRLAFTAQFRLQVEDQLRGASLVRQIFGYHVIAPPAGYVLMPATSPGSRR